MCLEAKKGRLDKYRGDYLHWAMTSTLIATKTAIMITMIVRIIEMKISETMMVGWSPALSGSETSASRSKRGRALRVREVNLVNVISSTLLIEISCFWSNHDVDGSNETDDGLPHWTSWKGWGSGFRQFPPFRPLELSREVSFDQPWVGFDKFGLSE